MQPENSRELVRHEGRYLEVKARKSASSAVWRRLIRKFFEYFEGFLEEGIFHDVTDYQENKPLIIKK